PQRAGKLLRLERHLLQLHERRRAVRPHGLPDRRDLPGVLAALRRRRRRPVVSAISPALRGPAPTGWAPAARGFVWPPRSTSWRAPRLPAPSFASCDRCRPSSTYGGAPPVGPGRSAPA